MFFSLDIWNSNYCNIDKYDVKLLELCHEINNIQV